MWKLPRAVTIAAFLLAGSVAAAMAAPGDGKSGGPDNAANTPTPNTVNGTADKTGPALVSPSSMTPGSAAMMPINPAPGDGKSGGPENAANTPTPHTGNWTADKATPMIGTPGKMPPPDRVGQTTAKPAKGDGSSGGVSTGSDGAGGK